MCNQSKATFRSVAVSFVKHGSDVPICQFLSAFAPILMGAYLPFFVVVRQLEKMPVDHGKPTGGMRDELWLGHLF